MTHARQSTALSPVLITVGLIFIFGIWPLMRIWPSGWQWAPSQPEYEQMIQGLYATLGVFLILASRDPLANRSLILFSAWSSLVHAVIMALQAIADPAERGHLIGDVPVLAIVGIVLLVLAPAERALESSSRGI